jgi:hypothetical protein
MLVWYLLPYWQAAPLYCTAAPRWCLRSLSPHVLLVLKQLKYGAVASLARFWSRYSPLALYLFSSSHTCITRSTCLYTMYVIIIGHLSSCKVQEDHQRHMFFVFTPVLAPERSDKRARPDAHAALCFPCSRQHASACAYVSLVHTGLRLGCCPRCHTAHEDRSRPLSAFHAYPMYNTRSIFRTLRRNIYNIRLKTNKTLETCFWNT